MTNRRVGAESLQPLGAPRQTLEAHPGRELALGALTVARALPVHGRRMVGPWCFLDRFGPLSFTDGAPMDVAPHPHMGLQTVTWLMAGEVVHDDSLGEHGLLRPGALHVMTAGHAIAHAERTPRDHTGRLNGVQLWTALPDAHRRTAPTFQHVPEVPTIHCSGGLLRVFSGTLEHWTSPARHFSELVGADLHVHRHGSLSVSVEPHFEHAVLVLDGDCALDGQVLEPRVLYYLGMQRTALTVSSAGGGRLLLIGGPPFPDPILMWWNFVARTPDEIREAREDWEAHRRFGDVPAYPGPRLAAPALARLAAPNPMS